MAITIRQTPTSPAKANSTVLSLVSSDQSAQPQYQYVLDIKDSSDTLIQRVKQQPNTNNRGIFNPSQILVSNLGPTDPVWDVSEVTPNDNCGKEFKLVFGEQYGTSPSSSVTVYTPDTSGSLYTFALNGSANDSQLISYNWNSGSKYVERDATDDIEFNFQHGLTSFDTIKLREGDYHTISFLNGNVNGAEENATLAQDVYCMVVKQYDASGALLDTDTIYNLAGPRTTSVESWGETYTQQNQTTRLVHFPVGYQNLAEAGINFPSQGMSYYTVEFHAQGTDRTPNLNGVWGSYTVNVYEQDCDFPGVRFAWKNEWGVWDYYNFDLAESTTTSVERNSYQQSFVDYSQGGNSLTYNRERRGENQYYNKISKSRTAQTGYLSQTEADNLRELFFSTDVYLQTDSGEYWPVVIENGSVTEKTNPRSQKLFTYSVTYKYANDQQPRQ